MAVAETAQRAQRRGEAREKAWDSEAAPLRRPGRVARWRRVAWLHSASLVLLVALRDTAAGGEPDDWPIFEKVRRRMPGCLGTRVSVCPCARVPACPCARVSRVPRAPRVLAPRTANHDTRQIRARASDAAAGVSGDAGAGAGAGGAADTRRAHACFNALQSPQVLLELLVRAGAGPERVGWCWLGVRLVPSSVLPLPRALSPAWSLDRARARSRSVARSLLCRAWELTEGSLTEDYRLYAAQSFCVHEHAHARARAHTHTHRRS